MAERTSVTITRRRRPELVLISAAQYDLLMDAIKWIFGKANTLVVPVEELPCTETAGDDIPSNAKGEMTGTLDRSDICESENDQNETLDCIDIKGLRVRLSELQEWREVALRDVFAAISVDPEAFDIRRLPKKAQRIVRSAYQFITPMGGDGWTYLARNRFDELQSAVRDAYGISDPRRTFENFLISERVVAPGTRIYTEVSEEC